MAFVSKKKGDRNRKRNLGKQRAEMGGGAKACFISLEERFYFGKEKEFVNKNERREITKEKQTKEQRERAAFFLEATRNSLTFSFPYVFYYFLHESYNHDLRHPPLI